jgi:hypothetical protein
MTGLAFGLYAAGLFAAARWAGHAAFDGWAARLLTMGLLAIGLIPWGRWLRPRVARILDTAGRGFMTACYFIVLAPFAAAVRLGSDPLRRRRGSGSSQWLPRAPLPDTIDAARLES